MIDLDFELVGRDREVLLVRTPRDLTHEVADALRECVIRHIPPRDDAGVILDMAAVTIISSIGIAALLQIAEACKDRAAPLYLAALPDRQLKFLQMLKLDRKFPMVPSIDDALHALAQRNS